jgi:hypothetical protein
MPCISVCVFTIVPAAVYFEVCVRERKKKTPASQCCADSKKTAFFLLFNVLLLRFMFGNFAQLLLLNI